MKDISPPDRAMTDSQSAPSVESDSPPTGAPAIIVTASAARRIVAIVTAESGGTMLRIAVNGGGCSGFRYDFSLEDSVAEDDVRFERDGAIGRRCAERIEDGGRHQ